MPRDPTDHCCACRCHASSRWALSEAVGQKRPDPRHHRGQPLIIEFLSFLARVFSACIPLCKNTLRARRLCRLIASELAHQHPLIASVPCGRTHVSQSCKTGLFSQDFPRKRQERESHAEAQSPQRGDCPLITLMNANQIGGEHGVSFLRYWPVENSHRFSIRVHSRYSRADPTRNDPG